MSTVPKILIAIPTYEGMSYCLSEFLDALKKLTYIKFDVLIADNSANDNYSQNLKKKGFKVIRSKRFENSKKRTGICKL